MFFYKNGYLAPHAKFRRRGGIFSLSKKFPLLDHTLAMAQALDIVIVNTIAIQL